MTELVQGGDELWSEFLVETLVDSHPGYHILETRCTDCPHVRTLVTPGLAEFSGLAECSAIGGGCLREIAVLFGDLKKNIGQDGTIL